MDGTDSTTATFHSPTGDFTQDLPRVAGRLPAVIYPHHNDLDGQRRWPWRYRRRGLTADYDYDPLFVLPED